MLMKPYTKILTTFFAFLIGIFSGAAQENTEGIYYHPEPGYYTFGINAGWAYQSSDIRTSFDGFGASLTFGKNLYYRPGAPLSFDVRGRLLYARMYGYDGEKSFDISNNTALNGTNGNPDYTFYPAALSVDPGFAYQNHRTDLGEAALEGVFRLNALRENTGVLVGLYGGIGADYYLTRTNQLNSVNGGAYYEDYAGLSADLNTREAVGRLQDGVLDGTFETRADGFANGGKLDWMPSLGLELGYQLSPNLAILAGHRTTFTRSNIIDGEQYADTNNDLYHYTSLGLEWNLNSASKRPRKPEIDLRVPAYSPSVQSSRNANVRADIRYINSMADVEFFVNNRPERFNYTAGRFTSDFSLRPGRNELVIAATNQVGTTRRLFVINWEEGNVISTPDVPNTQNNPPTGNAPQVRFNNPTGDNTRTQNADYRIRAAVRGARTQSDITLTVNGSNRNFNYDSRSESLTADIRLAEGRNNVIIRARNRFGSDEERRSIILERRGNAPSVRITRPANNQSVTGSRTNLEANITDTDRSSDITVTLNGRRINNFDYRNTLLTANIDGLRTGNNTIIVTARNAYGSNTDRVNVRYTKPDFDDPAAPPRVTFSRPTNNSETNSSTVNVQAKITNVRNRNDIRLTVNSGNVSGFNFNSLSGQLTANINLTEGSNTITVRGTNADGQDQASVNVRYVRPAGNKPTVTITQPTQNPYNSKNQVTTVKANVKHVSDKNKVTVEVNGRRVSNFGFTGNGNLSVQVSLREGNNTVRIRATNREGSDEATVIIRYNPVKNPPTVNITSPQNGVTSPSNKINVRATVNNAAKGQITVLNDGRKVSNFSLQGSKLTAIITASPGSHTLTVRAVNSDGRDEDSVDYSVAAPPAKPTVRITQPAKEGTVVRQPKATLKAVVSNVAKQSEISVLLNGRAVNFDYNAKTRTVTAALTLRKGKNQAEIKVRTSAGQVSAARSITYQNVSDIPTGKQRPKITISSVSAPAINPFEPDKGKSTIIAVIENITDKRDITFTYRGQTVRDFTFDASAKRFQITVDLERGSNSFTIKATNKAGQDTVSRVIEF